MSDITPRDELEQTESLVDGLVSGQTSRDEFIKRAGMLGLSATAIGGMLAAAGKATAGDLHEARRLAGSTVNLLVPAEGAQLGVQDKMAYMKQQFGIDVKMTALPVGPLNEKLSASVKASTGTYDLISVLGFTVAAVRRRRLLHAAYPLHQDAAEELRLSRTTTHRASWTT